MLIVNSFPKSGTNLVQKLLEPVGNYVGFLYTYQGQTGEKMPFHIQERALREMPVDYNNYATMHLHWSPQFAKILEDAGWKMILLVRDPRDVIVSAAYYYANTPAHHLHGMFAKLPHSQRISLAMMGAPSRIESFPDIGNRLLRYLGWASYDHVSVFTFEELIERPETSVPEIVYFWTERGLKKETWKKMIANAQKGSQTYRKGKAGEWKTEFTPGQKKYFNKHFAWLLGLMEELTGYEWD